MKKMVVFREIILWFSSLVVYSRGGANVGVSPIQENLSVRFKADVYCTAMKSKLISKKTITSKGFKDFQNKVIEMLNLIGNLQN